MHKFINLNQFTPLVLPVSPHQNWLIIELRSIPTPRRSLKQDIVYIGIAWEIDLIKISLLTLDNNLDDYNKLTTPHTILYRIKHDFFSSPYKRWHSQISFQICHLMFMHVKTKMIPPYFRGIWAKTNFRFLNQLARPQAIQINNSLQSITLLRRGPPKHELCYNPQKTDVKLTKLR